MAQYAAQLHDAIVIYATVANQTLGANHDIRDGSWMFNRTPAIYEGQLCSSRISFLFKTRSELNISYG